MEQIDILTKLVQEVNEMDCGRENWFLFLRSLDGAVRNLTSVKEHIARDMRWEAGREEREAKKAEKWEAGREEREAKEAKKEQQRVIHEAWKREQKNQRRRELYQLKKAVKKATVYCDRCEEYPVYINEWNWCETCWFNNACDSEDCEDGNCVCLPRKEKCVRKVVN